MRFLMCLALASMLPAGCGKKGASHPELPKAEQAAAATVEKLGGEFEIREGHIDVIYLGLGEKTREFEGGELAAFSQLPAVRKIYLTSQPIADEDLKHLSQLQTLEHLDLDATQVTDAGLEHLKDLKQLKTISARQTGVTRQGELDIKEALPNLVGVTW